MLPTQTDTWISESISDLSAAESARAFFTQAAAVGVNATLILTPEHMINGKCCLAYQTDDELILMELSPEQQLAFALEPYDIVQLPSPTTPQDLAPDRMITLMDVWFDARYQNPHKLMTGMFTYESDDTMSCQGLRCLLRMRFTHPKSGEGVLTFSGEDIMSSVGQMPFSIEPLASAPNVDPPLGLWVVCTDVVTTTTWEAQRPECQRLSNTLVEVINFV